MKQAFGEIIQYHRLKNGWTVKEFISKLDMTISPTYVTKIELHNEIPAPEVICAMALILKLDAKKLCAAALENKVQSFKDSLENKYKKALEYYVPQALKNN